MVGFFVGLFIGGTLGFLICAVVVAGAEEDHIAQEIEHDEYESHTFYIGDWHE